MLNVLIVDDSLILRNQLKEIMEALGHTVVGGAKNAEEAISMYSRLEVDLVTMDIVMTGQDGIYATQEIRMNDKNAKIVMVTSHGQDYMVVDALRAGAVGYILKPITEDKVTAIIKTVFKDK